MTSQTRNTVLILLGVAFVFLFFDAAFIVKENEQGFITQLKRPIDRRINTPGIKFKLPIIQQVHKFEKRFLEWDGDANELTTRDKRFIWVDTYARWRITDPLLFFERLKDEPGARTRLDDILDGETRNAIANHDVIEVVRSSNRTLSDEALAAGEQEGSMDRFEMISVGREAIRQEILEKAAQRTSDLGIEVLDFQFKRINYVDEVQQKVYERMITERKRIADRFRSEGEGEASRIRGEKGRELKRIQSDAYRQAETIIGRADSTATQIYAAAYDRNPATRDFYTFLKTMESYRSTVDPETWLIMSTDSEFYRFLKSSEGK